MVCFQDVDSTSQKVFEKKDIIIFDDVDSTLKNVFKVTRDDFQDLEVSSHDDLKMTS